MSGSEKHLRALLVAWRLCGVELEREEMEEEVGEGNRPLSGLMYRDWVPSLRRAGCFCLLIRLKPWLAGGVEGRSGGLRVDARRQLYRAEDDRAMVLWPGGGARGD